MEEKELTIEEIKDIIKSGENVNIEILFEGGKE